MNHQELAATVRNVLAHSYDEDALAALDSLVEQYQAAQQERDEWRRVAEELARVPQGEEDEA